MNDKVENPEICQKTKQQKRNDKLPKVKTEKLQEIEWAFEQNEKYGKYHLKVRIIYRENYMFCLGKKTLTVTSSISLFSYIIVYFSCYMYLVKSRSRKGYWLVVWSFVVWKVLSAFAPEELLNHRLEWF